MAGKAGNKCCTEIMRLGLENMSGTTMRYICTVIENIGNTKVNKKCLRKTLLIISTFGLLTTLYTMDGGYSDVVVIIIVFISSLSTSYELYDLMSGLTVDKKGVVDRLSSLYLYGFILGVSAILLVALKNVF